MFADKVISGSFTTPASGNVPALLKLPFIPNVFQVWVNGSAGSVWGGTNGAVVRAFWQDAMPAGSALADTVGAASALSSKYLSSGGITPVQSFANLYGSGVAGTAITNASPPVATTTPSNPWLSGSIVQFEQTTGSLQLSLFPWSVTQLTATTYQLGDPAGGFSAPGNAATNFVGKQILYPFVFTPYISYIVGMGLGATTSVVTSFPHGLSVGDSVRLIVPAGWGATQVSGQQGQVLSVGDAWSFVVNINSSAASAFGFPSNAQAIAGVGLPQVVPFGDQASAFDMSATDMNYQGILIGNSAVAGNAILNANSALIHWTAQLSARDYVSLSF